MKVPVRYHSFSQNSVTSRHTEEADEYGFTQIQCEKKSLFFKIFFL